MRVRITIELAMHGTHYTDSATLLLGLHVPCRDNLAGQYAMYSGQYRGERLTPEEIQACFQRELLEICKPAFFMGIWELHAIASILRCRIQSVYPTFGGCAVRNHLHRMICPRTLEQEECPAAIMWTSTLGRSQPANNWTMNHFVVCLPATLLTSLAPETVAVPKQGDFLLVRLPKGSGHQEYAAQVTKISEEGVWGRYLEQCGKGWRHQESPVEFFLPDCDIIRPLTEQCTIFEGQSLVHILGWGV